MQKSSHHFVGIKRTRSLFALYCCMGKLLFSIPDQGIQPNLGQLLCSSLWAYTLYWLLCMNKKINLRLRESKKWIRKKRQWNRNVIHSSVCLLIKSSSFLYTFVDVVMCVVVGLPACEWLYLLRRSLACC